MFSFISLKVLNPLSFASRGGIANDINPQFKRARIAIRIELRLHIGEFVINEIGIRSVFLRGTFSGIKLFVVISARALVLKGTAPTEGESFLGESVSFGARFRVRSAADGRVVEINGFRGFNVGLRPITKSS